MLAWRRNDSTRRPGRQLPQAGCSLRDVVLDLAAGDPSLISVFAYRYAWRAFPTAHDATAIRSVGSDRDFSWKFRVPILCARQKEVRGLIVPVEKSPRMLLRVRNPALDFRGDC